MAEELSVKVFRFNPDSDVAPEFHDFQFPSFENMSILDVVMHIQNYMDKTLSFRFSCRVGMCGSCAMYINGRPRLACRTQVSSLKTQKITLMPLPNFPIIRDLVVDMEPFFDKWKKIRPYYVPKKEMTEPAIVPPGSTRIHRRYVGLYNLWCLLFRLLNGGHQCGVPGASYSKSSLHLNSR
jgi:succinate dehydrogenase/fumarate reductase iron-sulfur protein